MAKPTFSIDVGRDFSPTPLGRTRRQGRFSGEAFREDVFKPALVKHEYVVVDLDGISGVSTGFLDEAFGGVIADKTLTVEEFWRRVSIKTSKDPLLETEIRTFVLRGARRAENS